MGGGTENILVMSYFHSSSVSVSLFSMKSLLEEKRGQGERERSLNLEDRRVRRNCQALREITIAKTEIVK